MREKVRSDDIDLENSILRSSLGHWLRGSPADFPTGDEVDEGAELVLSDDGKSVWFAPVGVVTGIHLECGVDHRHYIGEIVAVWWRGFMSKGAERNPDRQRYADLFGRIAGGKHLPLIPPQVCTLDSHDEALTDALELLLETERGKC